MRRYLAAFAGLVLLTPTPSFAWHNQGHMMVAEVAWQHMGSGARCRAIWLLNSDKEYTRGLQNQTAIACDCGGSGSHTRSWTMTETSSARPLILVRSIELRPG